jgi:hypothetical protein
MTRSTQHAARIMGAASILASSFFLLASAASAATIQPGDLIKASGPSVYYYGQDGKRYVFPNEKTYDTWYSGFNGVVTISDTELSTYAIGANVTYRPGVKLVKITTDPKVYAVANNGTLRWVMTESVARDLYGADWNTKVDDIADTFFVNYHVGTPIMNATDFSPTTETANSPSIGVDKHLGQVTTPTPTSTTPTSTTPLPTPTSTHSGTLVPSNPNPAQNDLVTLTANAMPSSGLWYVNIFFDGVLTRRCEFSPCGADVRMPTGRSSVDSLAEFVWTDGGRYLTTTTIQLAQGSPGTTLTITRPELKPGDQREVIVDVDASFSAAAIDIFLDGGDVKGCNNVQQCRYSATETDPIGTTHTAYGIIRDANGFTRQTATGSFSVVANPRPNVTVLVGKNDMYVGESVDATANSQDDGGIAWTEIATDDGLNVKRCNNTNVCTMTVMRNSAGTFHFVGRAADMSGLVGSTTSTAVNVH